MGGRSNTRKMQDQLSSLSKAMGPYSDQIRVVDRAYAPVRDIEAILRGENPASISELAVDAVVAADAAAASVASDAQAAAAKRRAVLESRRDALKDLYKEHRVKLAKLYNRAIQAASGDALRDADYVVIRRRKEIQALHFIGKLSSVVIDETVRAEQREQLLNEVARLDSMRGRNRRDPDVLY